MQFSTTLVRSGMALGLASLMSLVAATAWGDVIEGNWKTQSGETAAITKCGGSFCIKLRTGKYSGKSIGRMKGANGKYTGTITDPADNKKYAGNIKISGSTMKMQGCALKIFCKTQTWKKK